MPFWTLGRVSVGLQVLLVGLVAVVLAVSMQTLVTQNAEFARQAADRAAAAEQATARNRAAIQTVTCILLIPPDARTTERLAVECGVIFP